MSVAVDLPAAAGYAGRQSHAGLHAKNGTMIANPPSTARVVARIAIAFAATWLIILLMIILLHPLLIFAPIPWHFAPMMGDAAKVLLLLSVAVVPIVVAQHALMIRRGKYGPGGYITYGAVAGMSLLIITLAVSHKLGIEWSVLTALDSVGRLISDVLAVFIGAASSAVAWRLVIRPLRPDVRDLASTFD